MDMGKHPIQAMTHCWWWQTCTAKLHSCRRADGNPVITRWIFEPSWDPWPLNRWCFHNWQSTGPKQPPGTPNITMYHCASMQDCIQHWSPASKGTKKWLNKIPFSFNLCPNVVEKKVWKERLAVWLCFFLVLFCGCASFPKPPWRKCYPKFKNGKLYNFAVEVDPGLCVCVLHHCQLELPTVVYWT